MKITPRTFWFALNQTGWNPLSDALTGTNLTLPKANTTRFLFAFFNGDICRADNFADDISNVASCTLVLRKSNENGVLLYFKTILAKDFNNSACTYRAWSSQTDWQAGFELSKLETNWAPSTNWDEKIWVAVQVTLGDGSDVTLGHGLIHLVDPGVDTTDPVTQNLQMKASTSEAQAGTDDMKWMTPLKTFQAIQQNLKPKNFTKPTIVGFPKVGYALNVSTGVWANSPTIYNYQWQTSLNALVWTNINGATSSTYLPQSGDLNNYLRCLVAGVNFYGFDSVATLATEKIKMPLFPPGAIAYWKLDELVAGGYDHTGLVDLSDSTGNGHNLTAFSNYGSGEGPQAADMFVDMGVLHEGVYFQNEKWLQNSSFPAFGSNDFTISCWFKADVSSGGVYQDIISTRNNGGFSLTVTDAYDIIVYSNNAGTVLNSNTKVVPLTYPPQDASWVLLTLVRSGNITLLYINGNLDSTGSGMGQQTSTVFCIGSTQGNFEFAYGWVDEVGVWQRALDANEVSLIYSGGTPPSYS